MSLSRPVQDEKKEKPSGIAELWQGYLTLLDQYPVRTKALTAAFLSVVSDLLAQNLGGMPFNGRSVVNQFLIGLFVRGPVVHYWYKVLEWIFRGTKDEEVSTVIGKVALDQAIFARFFNWLYFYLIGTLEGQTLAAIALKVAQDYPGVMAANYKIWPLVNFINFKFVPPNLRVLFGNIVAVFWTVLLITLTRGKQ
eukprot:TRINITY_DN1295_c0_g1_i1.p2 TRINITY_DN1295_c0_g1~~TRINITY_DN1295_c0_g1_i1.p2  ORF type:complete len:195 (+),score=54.90 TRINITY_DN1295_c0_g1_i1:86-670(+)